MSLRLVVRKDFSDFVRSKAFWSVSAVFFLLIVGDAYFYTSHSYNSGTAVDVVLNLLSAARALVPLVALLVGYRALAGERESGTLKLLLGLPHSRRDVLYGKLVARCAVLFLPLVASFTLAVVLIVLQSGQFSLAPYVLFAGATVLLGVVFVAIAVGLSGTATTGRRAGVLAVGAFALFELFWGVIVNLVAYFKTGTSMMTFPLPAWAYFVRRLSPTGAYEGLLRTSISPTLRLASGGSPPVYLSPWVSLGVLLFWGTVPLVLGYWRFENADIQ